MRCAVIGDPAGHSLSPAIHRAAYDAAGLDWSYDAVTVAPSDLSDFLSVRLADPEWAGLSVTAPHKEAVMAFGEPDHVVRLVGAGNTLVFGDSPAVHNTDVPGFVRAWRARGGGAVRQAAILGNGATARSIMVALAGLEAREVTVLARTPSRAATLVDLGTALGMNVTAEPLDAAVDGFDLLASTVPTAATEPFATAWAKASASIFDVVYDPWPTPLGLAAAHAGRASLNGLDLLAGQAVDQFHLLTGRHTTFDACRSAAVAELRRRGGTVEE